MASRRQGQETPTLLLQHPTNLSISFPSVPFNSFSALALLAGVGVSMDKHSQSSPVPCPGGAAGIPAGAALSGGDGNPPVLIFGGGFPNQRYGGLRRRLEKLKDRWGKTTLVVTQLADGYLSRREMFFSLFTTINLSHSPLSLRLVSSGQEARRLPAA